LRWLSVMAFDLRSLAFGLGSLNLDLSLWVG
jgi:hypothetical protein